jgi:hypothetical protein
VANVEPWSSAAASEDERLARLFGAVEEPSPLPELARERVRRRLRERRPRRPGLVFLRLVAVGAVLGVAGAAAAQWTALRWLEARHGAKEASVAPPRPALSPQPVLPRSPRAVTLAPSAEAATPVPSSAAPVSAPSSPSSRLGLEASSLQAAVSALRGGAPGAALSALDSHLRKFPGGVLELEARVARLDALLLLGRRDEARLDLATLPLERVGRRQELRLLRAELEADRDCRRALPDFEVLMAQSLPTPWGERALFGRGACRRKLGDEAGATSDFTLYLERFPDGRFAPQLRAERSR